MHTIVIIATVIVAILLIGIVLIQKSKGGGLSSQFGGAGSMMSVRQTNSVLERGTWILVGCLVFLSIISAFTMPRHAASTQLRTQPAAPAAPVEIPAGQFDTPAVPVADQAAEQASDEIAAIEVATEEGAE